MRSLVLLALLTSPASLAQDAPAIVEENATASSASDSTVAALGPDLFTFSLLADSTQAVIDRIPRPEPAPVVEVEPPTPTLHVFGTSGVSFLAPADWTTQTTAIERDGYSRFTATNATDGHPLDGATVTVERIVGLNPLLRERFLRGQTPFGTHGAEAIGPIAVPEGVGLEVAGPDACGAAVYVARGAVLWAISVQAPASTWNARRPNVMALLTNLRLPE